MKDDQLLARLLQVVTLQYERALALFREVDMKQRAAEAQIRTLENQVPPVPTEIGTALATERWERWRQERVKSLKQEYLSRQTSWNELRRNAQQAQARRQVVEKLIVRNRMNTARERARKAAWNQNPVKRPAVRCRR